ncbi:MAG: nitroreductase family protein [Flavobacteriaceae bacterium]|jgi:nitroreductase|nr:nitroreductase family protein [Flavobacteriaceae bacterium]|tara:strand:- start:657 stop:1379 length:723 start_codon:yes stop_codon:yes gene_type:complete
MQEKTVSEAIAHRRSVRIYDPKKSIDTERVKYCIKQATLAASSSNLQLWEFYHITSSDMKKKVAINCYNQSAAKTAQELVIPVVRLDLWRERIKSNVDFIQLNVKTPEDEKKIQGALKYYQKIIPQLYNATSYFYGLINKIKVSFQGLRNVTYREVTSEDLRVVGHKSTALAAQNFMMSMAGYGYDTCPMEGFDSKRLKQILKLPSASQISMVIGCGIRKTEGVYGERFRIPFKEVYREL